MRLLRVGPAGAERPVVLDAHDVARDLTPLTADIDGAFLAGGGVDRVRQALADGVLPVVDLAGQRVGAPVARPGKVLLDREMHDVLKPLTDEFRVRRARTATVRGYTRLDTWALKAPKQPKAKPPRREQGGHAHPLSVDR